MAEKMENTVLPPLSFLRQGARVAAPQAPLLGLYYSAAWCGPCKSFTPKLAEFYADTSRSVLEIAFVSLDQNKAAFETYYATMPWLAADYDACDRDELAGAMGVTSIPTLIVFRPLTGEIVALDGKEDVRTLSPAQVIAKWQGHA
jgi:nucleoredoxin